MLLQKMPSARRSAAPRSEGNHSVVVAGAGRGRNSIRASALAVGEPGPTTSFHRLHPVCLGGPPRSRKNCAEKVTTHPSIDAHHTLNLENPI